MAKEVSFATGDPVTVKCFTFQNPDSINGPFGSFQLWINGSNVEGQMTINLLFGLGSTTSLNLTGSLNGTSPIICTLAGTGVFVPRGQSALSVEMGINLSFASDWSTGQLTFSTGTSGLSGSLPVQQVDCATA